MLILDNKYQSKRALSKQKKFRKLQAYTEVQKNKDYGEECIKADIDNSMLEEMKNAFLVNLYKSSEERKRIERQTILQSQSSEWLELRRSLLTASNFGKVIKMRPDTSCATPDILYLGATPDGVTEDGSIVEVKCPISAYRMGLEEAII
ncbi:hypothetical protein ACJJTC_015794 [Scirpophaga incertulas]